jgi:formyltetrahydrofolate deformylase
MTDHMILTIACPDRHGIVAAVSGLLAETGAFITESTHFGDPDTGRFFMRTVFRVDGGQRRTAVAEAFAPIGARFAMDWELHDAAHRPNVVILVSKFGHCLNDLLYRYRTGDLPIRIPAIVSNHPDFASLAEWHGIPFHHLPVTPERKPAQEAKLLELVAETGAELVVLARYMQVLSPELCTGLAGRAINIHHSFLPSFKGARPYQKAHERGVKLIGATAHYVTPDLDEGPIIEQETARVDHTFTVRDLVALGRDVENLVLARAVRAHVERRVLLNGMKTVVLR